jgi:ACT domain-containing protein
MVKKLYCYVDESGQNTKGNVFIVSAVSWKKPNSKYTTHIYVDGLTKTKRHEFGASIRHLGIPVRKIQGIARDETNAFTRLADAIAGFILDAVDGRSQEIKSLFRKANKEGLIVNVSP